MPMLVEYVNQSPMTCELPNMPPRTVCGTATESPLLVVHFVLSLIEAFGLVLVVWALTRALRGGVPRPA